MPQDDKDRDEREYQALLTIFQHYQGTDADDDGRLDIIEEMMALRAEHLIGRALDGFGMSLDEAIEILRNTDDLTELEAARRNIVLAAVDNLVDFAVAEEYQMLDEASDVEEGGEETEEDEDTEDLLLAIFERYNKQYAVVENNDAEYAMIIASALVAVGSTTLLTYMTQGDERVRPWHLQFEGYTAPKSSFPAWLIPPIEHMCRCYLVEDSVMGSMVQAAQKKELQMPDWFNPTFKESVALGGRIFSEDHPYFRIKAEHNGILQDMAQRIKKKYYNASTSN